MYQSYYNLREKPFSLLPDPAFLYVSSKHRRALAKLRSGILNRAGMTVITGEIGSGKTTLIQHLIRELDSEMTIGLINNVHSRFDDLLVWVLHAFGIDAQDTSEAKHYLAFVNFVKHQTTHGRRTLLIIDETQNMPAPVLEELRLLMNINVDYPTFQVVLVGQPELRGVLEQPDMRQFAQRVVVEHHLRPLDEEETVQYIQHRLVVAGGDPQLFSTEACELIYQRSHGVPRVINSLCDTMLEYGYEMQRELIDSALVRDILSDNVNGQLLALAEPYHVSNRLSSIHAEREYLVANHTNDNNVLRIDEHAQAEGRLRRLNQVPVDSNQRHVEHATDGVDVSRQVTGRKPRTLDEVLKVLSDFLD